MKKILVVLSLLFLLFHVHAQQRFEPEIRAFESLDSAEHPATGQILLYGSSTMRLWNTYNRDLTGYKVVNRGFGGSEMSDAVYFFDRVVVPLQPSLILLYEGDNDISNGKKTPAQIFEDFKVFMAMVAEKLPETRVAVYSLRPSTARVKTMPEQRLVNDLFKKYCQENPKKAYYIDVFETLLTESGLPNSEYLAPDHLHLNEKGYGLWTKATRDFLERINIQ
jgi:lysophospholipase L1-like esterase